MSTAGTSDLEDVVASDPEALREQALRRLKQRRDFKAHLFVYFVVNVVVWGAWVVIGLSSHSWWPWPVFMTLGWGIGVVLNAWDVYLRRPITEDEVRREVEHLRGSS
jgi:fatty acid desaturase